MVRRKKLHEIPTRKLDVALGIKECIDCGRRVEVEPHMPFYSYCPNGDTVEYWLCEECFYFRYRDGR